MKSIYNPSLCTIKIVALESYEHVDHPIYKEIAQSKMERVKFEQHEVDLYPKCDCCFVPKG